MCKEKKEEERMNRSEPILSVKHKGRFRKEKERDRVMIDQGMVIEAQRRLLSTK